MRTRTVLLGLLLPAPCSLADTPVIRNEQGRPLPQVMVTRTPTADIAADLSDDGYTPHGVTNTSPTVVTRFSNAAGRVSFASAGEAARYRARAQGYVDAYFDELPEKLVMKAMSREQYSAVQRHTWSGFHRRPRRRARSPSAPYRALRYSVHLMCPVECAFFFREREEI